jgi:MFS family permease
MTQLATGSLSDRWGRKGFIVFGMLIQGASLLAVAFSHTFVAWMIAAAALGIGTAMVYPTLLSAIGDVAHGYAIGAIGAGLLADRWGMTPAIAVVGLLTMATGVLAAVRMPETYRRLA